MTVVVGSGSGSDNKDHDRHSSEGGMINDGASSNNDYGGGTYNHGCNELFEIC